MTQSTSTGAFTYPAIVPDNSNDIPVPALISKNVHDTAAPDLGDAPDSLNISEIPLPPVSCSPPDEITQKVPTVLSPYSSVKSVVRTTVFSR